MSATTYGSSFRENEKQIGLGPTLAGICFAIVIAWALVSVLELTGTLTSAVTIKHRVRIINANLRPIHYQLSFITYAGKIAGETTQILNAAAPLSGQANTILVTARKIQKQVPEILTTATSINTTAHSINASVVAINNNVIGIGQSVASIGGHVASITNSVNSINASVASIGSRVTSILAHVGPIGTSGSGITADLTRTDNDFGGIVTAVHQIQPGLVTISHKVTNIQGTVTGIHSDFDGILANVGLQNGSPTVVGHANSIDCSNVVNLRIAGIQALGSSADCNMYQKT